MNFTLNNNLEFDSDDNFILIIGISTFVFCLIVELFNYIQNYRFNQRYINNETILTTDLNNTETEKTDDIKTEETINDDETEENNTETEENNTETEENNTETEDDDIEEIYELDESDEMKHVIKMYSFLTRKQLIKLVGVIGRNKRKLELIELAIEKFRVNMVRTIINQILTKKYIYLNTSAQEYLKQHKIEIEEELNDYFENTK